MKRPGSLTASGRARPGMICSVLSSAFVLLTIQARAEPALGAKCTGEADVPWTEQIAGCAKAIDSGKYAGKDLARILFLRGKAYCQTGDIDRCSADIEEAIRVDPTNATALGARGDLNLVKKDYARALGDYTKAAALDPGNPLVFIGRGMVHVATGNYDQALEDFEQAVRLQPTLAAGLYW